MGVRTGNSHAHIPRKRFGQHFLTDQAIIEAIVNAIAPKAGQRMVEIGPGLAALTQPLLERLGHLVVIELDRDLAGRLRLRPGLEVIEADVLAVDFAALASGEDRHAVHKETAGRTPQGGLGGDLRRRAVCIRGGVMRPSAGRVEPDSVAAAHGRACPAAAAR